MAKETKDVAAALKMIKDKEVKYVDLRFTDPRGKMQHLTMDVSQMGEDAWADGLMFDGSSIAGWKAINESDMVLMPDRILGPHGPVLCPDHHGGVLRHSRAGTGEGYARDPRMIAKRAEAYLKQTKIGDTVFVGPEAEFFIFDDVKFSTIALQDRLQAGLDRTAEQLGPRLRDRQHGPPDAHQGRLFPDEPDGLGAGHALRNALGHGRDGPGRRKAPP